MPTRIEAWRTRVNALRREVVAIALAARDPRTSWLARLLVLAIVAYALSPIDLIPDFIPVLGLLDELVLLPAALALAIHLIPAPVMGEARARANGHRLAPSRTAAALIVALWLAVVVAMLRFSWPYLPTWPD